MRSIEALEQIGDARRRSAARRRSTTPIRRSGSGRRWASSDSACPRGWPAGSSGVRTFAMRPRRLHGSPALARACCSSSFCSTHPAGVRSAAVLAVRRAGRRDLTPELVEIAERDPDGDLRAAASDAIVTIAGEAGPSALARGPRGSLDEAERIGFIGHLRALEGEGARRALLEVIRGDPSARGARGGPHGRRRVCSTQTSCSPWRAMVSTIRACWSAGRRSSFSRGIAPERAFPSLLETLRADDDPGRARERRRTGRGGVPRVRGPGAGDVTATDGTAVAGGRHRPLTSTTPICHGLLPDDGVERLAGGARGDRGRVAGSARHVSEMAGARRAGRGSGEQPCGSRPRRQPPDSAVCRNLLGTTSCRPRPRRTT